MRRCVPGTQGDVIGITNVSEFRTSRSIVDNSAEYILSGAQSRTVRSTVNYIGDSTAIGGAVLKKVYSFFYRMRTVYRARGGFASRGSLNPVRLWP